jgi:hypothetical protein
MEAVALSLQSTIKSRQPTWTFELSHVRRSRLEHHPDEYRLKINLLFLLFFRYTGLDLQGLDKTLPFFVEDKPVEFTLHAVDKLRSKGALDMPAAQGSCQNPARPTAFLSAIYPLRRIFIGGRTDAKLTGLLTARLTSAFLKLPTVYFDHVSSFVT